MGINRGPITALDSVFSDEPPVGDSDRFSVTLSFDGMDARWIMTEASARGISYSDMVQILVQQGMFTWTRKM